MNPTVFKLRRYAQELFAIRDCEHANLQLEAIAMIENLTPGGTLVEATPDIPDRKIRGPSIVDLNTGESTSLIVLPPSSD